MKRITAGLTALICLSTASTAWAGSCATKTELSGLSIRAMQSELMVAALACRQRPSYNNFAKKMSSELVELSSGMQSYFKRVHGRAAGNKMDNFVTQMANQASHVSLATPELQYCSQAATLFTAVNALSPWQLADYARDRYQSWHNISNCDEPKVAAAN